MGNADDADIGAESVTSAGLAAPVSAGLGSLAVQPAMVTPARIAASAAVPVTMASEAGQLQLNAFEPIMGWSLFKSIQHLNHGCQTLLVNCVTGIEANHALLAKRVRESVTLVTALNPLIGYEHAALIAKTAIATGEPIAQVAASLGIMSAAEVEAWLVPDKLTE